MLSRGIRYGFVVAGVFLIIVANVWFVQAPDTLRAYTDLFFMNTGIFRDYMLDTFNIQYMVRVSKVITFFCLAGVYVR